MADKLDDNIDDFIISLATLPKVNFEPLSVEVCRQRFGECVFRYMDLYPQIHPDCMIGPHSLVSGATVISEGVSIWPGTIIRADINHIIIGKYTNIQDNSVIHVANDYPTVIGEYVTVGHRAIVHAAKIGNNCLIGMGAIISNGVEIGDECIIGASAMIPPKMRIESGSVVFGVPGKLQRTLSLEERKHMKKWALKYYRIAQNYRTSAAQQMFRTDH